MDKAIILAGGFGTRLRSIVSDRPKALANIAGKPLIEHQLEWLIAQGVTEVTLAVHYMADQLQAFSEQWSSDKIKVDTVYESEPLGTGGAVANVIQHKNITGTIVVINGDTLFNFTLQSAFEFMQNKGEPFMLMVSKLDNVARFGTVDIEDGYVTSFKQATGKNEKGLVNSGVYLIDSALFSQEKIKPFSLEYDLFPKLVKNRKLIAHATEELENFTDIGTPDSYREVCKK